MKVSIITVVRNGASTISRSIESVLSQDYPSVEYIVVDGASTDCTLSIINSYGSRINVVISEPDDGIYDAMNKGIMRATGEIIGILNADDSYSSCHVLSEVAALFQIRDIDALYADLEYFSAERPNHVYRLYRSKYFSPNRLQFGLMPAHPTLFLRRSVYENYGLFSSAYKIAGDFEFVARIFKNDVLKYYYLPKILVRMQLGGVSTSGFSSAVILNKEILKACYSNNIPSNYLKLLLRYSLKLMELIKK
ncbi:glycosyltransferase [Polynucleobacter sp. UB-Piko-W3]|nr:glycosyltransferase [Polynucleobacter sp. UB-Piko-W3]